jgi:hypothetical protein
MLSLKSTTFDIGSETSGRLFVNSKVKQRIDSCCTRILNSGNASGLANLALLIMRLMRFNQGLRGKGSLVQADPWKNMT